MIDAVVDVLLHSYYIAKKDVREYYMKPATVSWGILFPVVFTAAFLVKRGVYSAWVAPGLLALTVFFSSTSMTGSSIMFERRFGSFERLLLFPTRLVSIALGKSFGGIVFGQVSFFISLLVVLLLIGATPANVALLLLATLLAAIHSAAFGLLLAFAVKDPTRIMTTFNMVRLPMIFFSGIIISLANMPLAVKAIAYLMPLTYPAELMRYAYLGRCEMPPLLSASLMALETLFFLYLSARMIRRTLE